MAKILLVDDAAFMRMMLKTTLGQAGYTDVIEAADGAQAVEMYQAEKPDLPSDTLAVQPPRSDTFRQEPQTSPPAYRNIVFFSRNQPHKR